MHIAICEDTAADLQRLEELLRTAVFATNLDAEIHRFSSGEALLSAVDGGFSPSVCFLDVYMAGTTGVDAAREIKKRHPRCAIVFVT